VMRANPIEKSAGNVIIPKDAQTKPCNGTVLAIGGGLILPDGSRGAMEVVKGDNVLFSSYAGIEVEGSPGLIVMRQDDILLVRDQG
jgi:chaperonin GroES